MQPPRRRFFMGDGVRSLQNRESSPPIHIVHGKPDTRSVDPPRRVVGGAVGPMATNTLNQIMCLVAAVFSLFLLPHVLHADGNLAALGFDYASFMPKKPSMPGQPQHLVPVPVEVELLIQHLVAVFGACGLALNLVLVVFALGSKDLHSKRLALFCHLCAQVLTMVVAWSKPPGTGAVGSPAGGSLSLQLTLVAVSVAGLVYG